MRLLKLDISKEATKYLIVGAGGYVIDTSLFNLLSLFATFGAQGSEPILYKTMSSVVGITFTYIANSRWTFKKRQGRPEGLGRILRYAAVNAVGLGIILSSLYVSRYVLGFESLLADNISANIVGTGLALVFRFLANRHWVFLRGS